GMLRGESAKRPVRGPLMRSSRRAPRRLLEREGRMLELLFVRRNVEDERLEPELDVAGKLDRDTLVAPDEIGTEGLVVLERPEPVRILRRGWLGTELGKLAVPVRVRDFHRERMGYLAFAVLGKPRACHLPCLRVVVASDDADAHADAGTVGQGGDLLVGRFRILHCGCPYCASRGDAGFRRSRDEDPGEKVRSKRGSQGQVFDGVVAAGEGHSL